MKKWLFLFISILSIFFITDNVNALTYTDSTGSEVEVNEENYLFYTYYNQPELFEEYDYFFVGYSSYNKTYEVFFSDYQWYYNSHGYMYSYSSNVMYYVLRYNSSLTSFTISSSSSYKNYSGADITTMLYSNYDITNKNGAVQFTSNITKEDLKNLFVKPTYTITYYVNNEVYQTIEVEKGSSHELLTYDYNDSTHIFSGWQYDENVDLTNITSNININATLEQKDVIPVYIEFPINKNEFYALLVEVGVLIMIIFLKWCFPFKGGSDLK